MRPPPSILGTSQKFEVLRGAGGMAGDHLCLVDDLDNSVCSLPSGTFSKRSTPRPSCGT